MIPLPIAIVCDAHGIVKMLKLNQELGCLDRELLAFETFSYYFTYGSDHTIST